MARVVVARVVVARMVVPTRRRVVGVAVVGLLPSVMTMARMLVAAVVSRRSVSGGTVVVFVGHRSALLVIR
ncbi:hypothetical protein O4090_08740 [Dietzia kunjamensis]|jgi:hypothetical protein|uniref:hypothetical protein n=1 Tax=Dietzia kunjamensis TaxID=322509 RepID=UPI0022727B51|nr:hypothetical protein [Dietzia kunjamensis]MCZ4656050.1 hypothetical protein [Dietzia kunjamensis]MDJ0422705.1 hypothetical protein [Dietzia kunjamensis]